ncbi:uncharacterized protein LOC127254164 [Andrographis paniculata]|uniref:uncharacterized protein LOC127254164 n=1 Tax=Andrographis paniculata TaxID=175694 RepID=UPI0021E78700|nr:uncharacterized protein LOC127254164 [Andrographis paniculata]
MAAFRHLMLSQTGCRRRLSPSPPHLLSLLRRRFSNEPAQPLPNPEPSDDARKSTPIQPVSYPVKPKPPVAEEIHEESPPERAASSAVPPEARSWTRDEMRYMKDAPSISPVSYAARTAPLPEAPVPASEKEEEKGDGNAELERERRNIDEYRRRVVHRFADEEEDRALPFPKLIKVENNDESSKKKSKAIYDLKEAIKLVKGNSRITFDETFEAHVKMTPELRRTDLKLNSFVRLPHGFGKTYRVAVFAEGAAADEATEAGADIVGGPELVENIRTGQVKVDFDKCIATPSMMEHVKKLSRNLKQLMPDTKKGTLTNNISRAVKEAKEQSVQFKKDKTAIVHVGLGKLSFSEDALRENVGAFVNALLLAKPAGLKKSSKFAGYIDSFHICSTMGSSFRVSIQSLSMAADRINRLQQ